MACKGLQYSLGNQREENLRSCPSSFINGIWSLDTGEPHTNLNPATEKPCGVVLYGSSLDVDLAVAAARQSFPSFSAATVSSRLALLDRIETAYLRRRKDLALAISEEIGAPMALADGAQTAGFLAHLGVMRKVLRSFEFDSPHGSVLISREPIGVCGLITPWNWPVGQVASKIIPALAAGCTVVLKPSELSPFSAQILMEILTEADVPPGVVNLVNGAGGVVGAAIASHPDIDMVSFTGSTRAGVNVARDAASTVKRVQQELGGKSPNVILPHSDIEKHVSHGVMAVMRNSGQSCNAPTRMFVHRDQMAAACAIASRVAAAVTVGPPGSEADIGPVISEAQWEKVQNYIKSGVAQGATLLAGGTGRPDGLDTGYFVKPTVFANVLPHMTIAKEEIFGPVLCISSYDTISNVIDAANDTPYGLAAYVSGSNLEEVRSVARRLRAGQISMNGAATDFSVPFGGYKQSGNGREWGESGLAEYLEVKAILGHGQ